MKPTDFEGTNVVYAKDQPEYNPLPALKVPGNEGILYTCWELTDEEAKEIARTKRLYVKMLSFNAPITPILPMANLGDDLEIHGCDNL